MRKFLSQLLGFIHIFGGALGFMLVIVQSATMIFDVASKQGISHTPIVNSMIIPLLFMVLYALSIRAGTALYRDQPAGYSLSAILQFLQIPIIVTKHFSYLFVVAIGGSLGTIFKGSKTMIDFQWVTNSQYWLKFSTVPIDYFAIYINIIPIFFLILLA